MPREDAPTRPAKDVSGLAGDWKDQVNFRYRPPSGRLQVTRYAVPQR
jgi:hypothetical protein